MPQPQRIHLGTLLEEKGLITSQQLEKAIKEQQALGIVGTGAC